MESDVGPKFKSALRSMLKHFGEGLMWMGLTWSGMHPPLGMRGTAAPDPDQLSMPPLSKEERAEWAALVERLR